MKKTLLFAASLLCALGAFAQDTATSPAKHTDKEAAKEHKHETKNQDDKTSPDNHGQQVQSFAHTTALSGADKGAAISALASNGRSAVHRQRQVGRARGERNHGGTRAGNCGHQGGGHQNEVAHHAGR